MAEKKKPRITGRKHTGHRHVHITKDGVKHHRSFTVTESYLSNGKSSFVTDEDYTVDSVQDDREKPRRGARFGIGKGGAVVGNLAGGFASIVSSFLAIYIFILLSRAYYHLPFIGVYDALLLLGNGTLNPFSENISIAFAGLDSFLGSMRWSFASIVPDSWKGIATVFDYTVNGPYITITILQMIGAVLKLFVNLVSVVFGFGNFITKMATSGDGIFAGTMSNVTRNARDNLWNMLIS